MHLNPLSINQFLNITLKMTKIKFLIFLKAFDYRCNPGVFVKGTQESELICVTKSKLQKQKWNIFFSEKIFCFWEDTDYCDGAWHKAKTLEKSIIKCDDNITKTWVFKAMSRRVFQTFRTFRNSKRTHENKIILWILCVKYCISLTKV